MDEKKNNRNIPKNVIFKVLITRLGIIWENSAKYFYILLCFVLLFFSISLLNIFESFTFWIHFASLIVFFVSTIFILVKLIFSLKWPSLVESIRRLENDNGIENRPLCSLFDFPALNKESIIWEKHNDNMLEEVKLLKNYKPKPVLKYIDPLFIRFPIIIVSAFFIFSYNNNFINKVEAALLPKMPEKISSDTILTGWISPPKYTRLEPIVLSKDVSDINTPAGSILTARIFGGNHNGELIFNGVKKDFTMIDNNNFAIESMINKSGDLIVEQNSEVILKKRLKIIKDKNPVVQLLQQPDRTVKGVLKMAYLFQDDYGITDAYARVKLIKVLENVDIKGFNFSIPFDEQIQGSQFVEYYHDLTEHIFAGMPVKLSLVAKDFVGNEGSSEEFEIMLPERVFNNPLAVAIINQRKNLGLRLIKLEEIISNIAFIESDEEIIDKYFIAKVWLSEVVILLKEIKNNSSVKEIKQKNNLSLKKLWKAALFVESGQLAQAEEDLRKAQEGLREALSQSNDASEVQESLTNLEEALGKYLDEVEEPQNVDAPQVSESDDPGDRGGENGAQPNEREDLEEKLKDIADLAVSGSLDEAQKQLEEMQDVTEAMDREALGEALGEEEGESQPMAMQQISEMIEQQEALMEDSFDQSMNAAQADQKTPGSGPVNAGKEQEVLRKQLEEVMKEIAESENPIPEELGRADRAMRHASRELNRNRPDRAQTAQGRAIEELRKAAENIEKMHSSDGPSQMAGNNEQNRSRDKRDPLGRVPPGQGSSPGGDVGLPNEPDFTKARRIAKQLYSKAEKSEEGTVERRYVDSLLDWY